MPQTIRPEFDFPCPICEHEVEYYDTAPDGKSGRYKCTNCGRDTTWATGVAMSFTDVLKEITKKFHQSIINAINTNPELKARFEAEKGRTVEEYFAEYADKEGIAEGVMSDYGLLPTGVFHENKG